jgi:hypothetical protein
MGITIHGIIELLLRFIREDREIVLNYSILECLSYWFDESNCFFGGLILMVCLMGKKFDH